jgi:hypothetical protein
MIRLILTVFSIAALAAFALTVATIDPASSTAALTMQG